MKSQPLPWHPFTVGTGAMLALTAVALGAFGAHLLKEKLTPENLAIYTTGVTYQMYHALGLLLVGMLRGRADSNKLKWGSTLLLAGVLIFSGSLYCLSLLDIRKFGMITPLGGVSMMAGWALVGWGVVQPGSANSKDINP